MSSLSPPSYPSSKQFVVFSGNSHRELAIGICKQLNVQLGECEIRYFSNGESRPIIGESVRNKDIFIVQTGSYDHSSTSKEQFGLYRNVNDHIQETLLLMDCCKRSGSNSITLIVANYPYARQDKKDKSRSCISASVVARQFETFGLTRIVCVELHNPCIQGFFNVCCDNLYTSNMMVDILQQKFNVNDLVIISPDEGGFKRASIVASKLQRPILTVRKNRDYSLENTVTQSTLLGDGELLKGKTAVIVDDMLDTGGTVCKTVKILKQQGAKDVIVIVTHGVLSGPALERINAEQYLTCVIVSNSLPQADNIKKCDKLIVYPLDEMLAKVMRSLIEGHSVSELFG